MNHRISLTLFASLLIATFSLRAATPAEMEQARAIAIKWCLRGMNTGSGYLNDQSPKTVADLEKGLKAKEKSNISKLKSITLPPESEYAAWGKEEFNKYWKDTFFGASSGDFADKGYCRGKAMSEISNIAVTAQSAPSADAAPEPAPEEPVADQSAQQPDEAAGVPDDMQMPDAAAEVEADSSAVAPADIEQSKKDDPGNTMAVVILVILVIVVVALVVYALNVMNKNRNREEEKKSARRRESTRREENIRTEEDNENDDKDQKIKYLTAEVARLRKELKEAREERESAQYAPQATSNRPVKTIYLAQADDTGVFLRADARFNPDKSIFCLDTSDGVAGSFSVINDSSVHDMALMMPDYLANACEGVSLRMARRGDTIVTERPGTAIFEDGRWRVSRKALLRIIR